MELGQAEALGVLDDDDAGIRHVDPNLDHRGRDQKPGVASGEGAERRLLVRARETAVDQPDPGAAELLREQAVALDRGHGRVVLAALDHGQIQIRSSRASGAAGGLGSTSSTRPFGTARVVIGLRPGGFSSSREVARSP